jgi:multidrug efflux system membrane fusion protein
MLRNWLVPTILLFSTALSATPSSAQEQQKPAVTVAKPVVRDVVDVDEFIGRFEAVDEVTVRSRIGGYLDQVGFTDGAMVKKGDQLFVIDQRPFQTTLDVATSSLEVAKSTLVFAEAEFTRTESLVQKGTLPVSTLDDRRRELRSALSCRPTKLR